MKNEMNVVRQGLSGMQMIDKDKWGNYRAIELFNK